MATTLHVNGWGKGEVKGTYRVQQIRQIEKTALVCCPECGKIKRLDDYHIGPDGRVTPPVQCDCGWCDEVVLDDWARFDKGAAIGRTSRRAT